MHETYVGIPSLGNLSCEDESRQCVTFKVSEVWNSLMIQWLGLGAFTVGGQVQSLVRELRSLKLHGLAKKKKKKNSEAYIWESQIGVGNQDFALKQTNSHTD